MISTEEAGGELMRLAGLKGYPRGKDAAPAIAELVKALATAHDYGIAESVISEWIAEYDGCPRPADLYRLIHERNPKGQDRSAGCQSCGGTGFTDAWFLMTYHGNSFRRKASERLNVATQKEADEFNTRIASTATPNQDYQDVVRGVYMCVCHPASRAPRKEPTGEHRRIEPAEAANY